MATDPGTAGIAAGIGGLGQAQAASNAANKTAKTNQRQLDIQESTLRDQGDIANLVLDLINSSDAFNSAKQKTEEAQILNKQSKRDQNFVNAEQTLPGGGDPRDTVAAEQRARLVAAQQDLQIRRNRTIDLDTIQAKIQAYLAAASIGGIRTPKFGSKSFQTRYGIAA